MTRRRVTFLIALIALLLAQGCLLRSDPSVPLSPADAPALEQRVRADSTDLEAVVGLAALQLIQGRADEARALMERTDVRAPADPAVPLLLALAEEGSGRLTSAHAGYERYGRSHVGELARMAQVRLLTIGPAALRADVRALLAEPLPPAPVASERAAVLPFGRAAADGASAAEAAAVAAFLATDLDLAGRDVVDDGTVRALLDEMGIAPAQLGDLALGVEVGRRLGAGTVVQGLTRRVSLGVVAWDVTMITFQSEVGLRVEQMSLEGGVGATIAMQRRLATLLLNADDDRYVREPGSTHTSSPGALVAFGSGLLAMDRGEIEAAHASFLEASQLDAEFIEAGALAARLQTVLEAPPLEALVQEVVRIGSLQRAVLALRTPPASVHQRALARVGGSDRAIGADLLGVDDLGGSVLLDLTFTLPGGSP